MSKDYACPSVRPTFYSAVVVCREIFQKKKDEYRSRDFDLGMMFKLIFFILVFISNFDLDDSSIVDETVLISLKKETGLKDDNNLVVVSLGNGNVENTEYFIGVTEKQVILSEGVQLDERVRRENLNLKIIDTRLLPDRFLIDKKYDDESMRLFYLAQNESALLCTDNIGNTQRVSFACH